MMVMASSRKDDGEVCAASLPEDIWLGNYGHNGARSIRHVMAER